MTRIGGKTATPPPPMVEDILGEEPARLYKEWSDDVERRMRAQLGSLAAELPQRQVRRRLVSWTRSPLAAALIALVVVSTALAVANMTNLGKPTDDVPDAYAQLGPFHRSGPAPHGNGPAKVYLFDTAWDMGTAMNRWFLVKALNQFGTWTGVGPGQTTEQIPVYFADTQGNQIHTHLAAAELDLSHARYTSRYVSLVHRVIQTHSHGPIARLSPGEEAVFQRFLHVHVAWAPGAVNQFYPPPDDFPVVAVGGYGMHGPFDNPFEVLVTTSPDGKVGPATFEGMQKALQTGDLAPGIGYLIREINSYANVVTALICHADGNRPASVCNRPAIKIIHKAIR